jgi:hypothetical protein
VTLTLWGAYHRLVRPLEQRSLTVHVTLERSAEPAAVIEAEGLVAHGNARLEARRSGFALEYRMRFLDDDRQPCRLELVQRFGGGTLRTWTELIGTLAGDDAVPWGAARLRVDYRDLEVGTLIETIGRVRRIIN